MMNNPLNSKPVLVAMDFTKSSAAALKQAVWLARRNGASLVLTHSIPDFSKSIHWGPYERQVNQRELHERAETNMRRVMADLNAMDLNVTFRTLVGEPFVAITRTIQAEGYDMVLAGTRGAGKLEQFFVGSTAKRLIRKCPASVWIVNAEHLVPPKVVLAATDFSDVSLKGVREGLKIAQQADAEFHLLHIIDSKDVPEDLISRVPEGSTLRQEIHEEAIRRLDEFLSSLTVDRAKIRSHMSWGTPWQEIRRIAKHQAAELIVIGTVGRSGIKGLLLGNTAERVLDTCDCSILTTKPDDFVSPIEPSTAP